MSILQKSSTDEVLGSTVVTSLRRRTATVVGAFLLATSFALAGGPAAAAAPDFRPDCGDQRSGPCTEPRGHHTDDWDGWWCGNPGQCPGYHHGHGQTSKLSVDGLGDVPVTRCAGRTPGICPGSETGRP